MYIRTRIVYWLQHDVVTCFSLVQSIRARLTTCSTCWIVHLCSFLIYACMQKLTSKDLWFSFTPDSYPSCFFYYQARLGMAPGLNVTYIHSSSKPSATSAQRWSQDFAFVKRMILFYLNTYKAMHSVLKRLWYRISQFLKRLPLTLLVHGLHSSKYTFPISSYLSIELKCASFELIWCHWSVKFLFQYLRN